MELQSTSVVSAHEVDPQELADFFAEMFPGRATGQIWQWLNRSSFFQERTPLALVEGKRVLAFSGMIPFHATIDREELVAAWFVDFAVRPDRQRGGLGSALTPKWATFPDAGLGFPNALSIGTARKVGWLENDSVRLLFFPVRPFDHPRVGSSVPSFLRPVLNGVGAAWYKRRYSKYASEGDSEIRPLEQGDLEVLSAASEQPEDGAFVPSRDLDYLKWRLWDSPDRGAYRFVRSGAACGVLKLRRKGAAKAVDLLLVEGAGAPDAEIQLIADVGLWAAKERCAYVRQLKSDPERAALLKVRLGAQSRPRPLVFQAPNKELRARLKQCRWRWQLLDSDFERFGESLG